MKSLLRKMLLKCGFDIKRLPVQAHIKEKCYIDSGYIPWSKGYLEFKNRYIENVLLNPELLKNFCNGKKLPENYGVGLDERCIEYPWFFINANSEAHLYLDAGSALNHNFILKNNFWNEKNLTIFTLAPEDYCFWNGGISYQYGDLKQMPFREGWFDEIACISTLEHVGMDNSYYSPVETGKNINTNIFEQALLELRRILKPHGRLLLTVPFGKYQNLKVFQQFDESLLKKAAAIFGAKKEEYHFYRYTENGWQIATADECMHCEYSKYAVSLWDKNKKKLKPETDNAAAARAVACVIWQRD